MMKLRELLVGRRGEAPLVPPYILPSFKRAMALAMCRVSASSIVCLSYPRAKTNHQRQLGLDRPR